MLAGLFHILTIFVAFFPPLSSLVHLWEHNPSSPINRISSRQHQENLPRHPLFKPFTAAQASCRTAAILAIAPTFLLPCPKHAARTALPTEFFTTNFPAASLPYSQAHLKISILKRRLLRKHRRMKPAYYPIDHFSVPSQNIHDPSAVSTTTQSFCNLVSPIEQMPSVSGSGAGELPAAANGLTATQNPATGIAVEAARCGDCDHEGRSNSSTSSLLSSTVSDDGEQDLHMESITIALILGHL